MTRLTRWQHSHIVTKPWQRQSAKPVETCQRIIGKLGRICEAPSAGHTYCPECAKFLLNLHTRPEPQRAMEQERHWTHVKKRIA